VINITTPTLQMVYSEAMSEPLRDFEFVTGGSGATDLATPTLFDGIDRITTDPDRARQGIYLVKAGLAGHDISLVGIPPVNTTTGEESVDDPGNGSTASNETEAGDVGDADHPFLIEPDFSEMQDFVARKGHEFFGLHRESKAASSEEQVRFLHTAIGKSSDLDPRTRWWYDRFIYSDAIKLGETALTQRIEVLALSPRAMQTSNVFRRPEVLHAVVEHMAGLNAPAGVAIRGLQEWLVRDGVRLRPATVSLSRRTYEQVLFGIYNRELSFIVERVAQKTLSTQ